jgi:hypothetical protein
MIKCIMVYARGGKYLRIPDAEVEDWKELLDGIDGEPELIERVSEYPPYTHAYRMPDRTVYLVALEADN